MSQNNRNPIRSRGTRGGNKRRGSLVAQMVRATNITNPSPPVYDSSHHYTKRIRFLLTAALVDYTITSSDVCNLLLAVNDIPVADPIVATCSALWSRFRLINAEMWATASGLTAASDISLEFVDPSNGTSSNSEARVSDVAKSIDQYAYVKLKPKSPSVASQWQNATTTGFGIKINAPIGTLMDLVVEVYINNDDPVQTVLAYLGVSGSPINPEMVPGVVFLNYLDASPTGTTPGTIVPLDYINPSVSSAPTPRPI